MSKKSSATKRRTKKRSVTSFLSDAEAVARLRGVLLRGSVNAQWVRCGTAGCRCASGELHGPYYYHFFRIGGRQHKVYLRRREVEEAQALERTRRHLNRAARARRRQSTTLLQSARQMLRDMERAR